MCGRASGSMCSTTSPPSTIYTLPDFYAKRFEPAVLSVRPSAGSVIQATMPPARRAVAMPDRLPHWVAGRDGRPEPFDGDRIYRSLFAAATRAGRPDPFLARELADAVLHFVAAGDVCDPLPVAELTDTVAKVVREVGQPVIARAYQEVRPTCDADDGDAAWFGLDAAESGRRAAAAGSVEDARQRV